MKKIIITLFSLLILNACAGIHVPAVQQGTLLDQVNIDQLKVGMTQRQVKFLLGSPSINDPFTPQRWDYLYTFTSNNQDDPRQIQHLVLMFDGDILSNIDYRKKLSAAMMPKPANHQRDTTSSGSHQH